MTLARPNYIDTDKIGRMIALYCKVCGAAIGVDRRGVFQRHGNYAELKMQFSDGDKHVTNICTQCIEVVAEQPALLGEMYQADLDVMVKEVPDLEQLRVKFNPRVVAVDTKRRGLP